MKWAAESHNATWVDFARLQRNPESELLRLVERLEIEVSSAVRMAVSDFINDRFTHPPVEDYPLIPDWANTAYELLIEAATRGQTARDLLASSDWQKNLVSSKGEREWISQQFHNIFAGDTQLDRLEHRIRSMTIALSKVEKLAEERQSGINSTNVRLRDAETALNEAATLAVDRLKLLASLDQKLREMHHALSCAEQIADDRMIKLKAMDHQLGETQSALDYAATLAEERLAVIVDLNAQLGSTSAALAKAEKLANDRLDELGRLAGNNFA